MPWKVARVALEKLEEALNQGELKGWRVTQVFPDPATGKIAIVAWKKGSEPVEGERERTCPNCRAALRPVPDPKSGTVWIDKTMTEHRCPQISAPRGPKRAFNP